jgi:hypothetical protein
MKYDIDNGMDFFKELGEYSRFNNLMTELEKHPVRTNADKNIQLFNNFCERYEQIKGDFIQYLINLNHIGVMTDDAFNKGLEPYLPKCNYDTKTEIFTMDFNFVPHLKVEYLQKLAKPKNALVFLIMEGIKRMHTRPNYDKEPVMIIFTVSKKHLFDVDNIEVKYIIDAMRYSKFFYDDSYDCVSYMVEGKKTDGQCQMAVKVVK